MQIQIRNQKISNDKPYQLQKHPVETKISLIEGRKENQNSSKMYNESPKCSHLNLAGQRGSNVEKHCRMLMYKCGMA